MKKSRKKIINQLKPLIGSPIIRIRPTFTGNYGWTESPIILCGFTPEGGLIVRNIVRFSGNNFVKNLPVDFTDYNWIPLEKVRKSGHNPLNKWQSKKIRRIIPVVLWQEQTIPSSLKNDPDVCILQQNNKDTSFMEGEYILIHDSKHHDFLKCSDGREAIRDYRYTNPAEWKLAE